MDDTTVSPDHGAGGRSPVPGLTPPRPRVSFPTMNIETHVQHHHHHAALTGGGRPVRA